MRVENTINKKIYQIYRKEILIPFIAHTRAYYGEWRVGVPITEELKAVSWCDGDLSHIDNIMNSTSLKIYKENNISENKKNAARSATGQAAELSRVFKIMPAMEKNNSQQYTL